MRYFTVNDKVMAVQDSQITGDEKAALLSAANKVLTAANAALEVLTEEDEGYAVAQAECVTAQAEVDRVTKIIQACPVGAAQLTDEQVEFHNTGLYEFVGGKQVEKAVDNTSAMLTLENSISARRWREALLGDEDAIAFIADIEAQIEVLR